MQETQRTLGGRRPGGRQASIGRIDGPLAAVGLYVCVSLVGCRGVPPPEALEILEPEQWSALDGPPVPILVSGGGPVRFAVDGVPLPGPELPIPSLGEGWHTLTAWRPDSGGAAARRRFMVDRRAPELFLRAALRARPAQRQVSIEVEIRDDRRVVFAHADGPGSVLRRPLSLANDVIRDPPDEPAIPEPDPEPDRAHWSGWTRLGEASTVTITAHDSAGHMAQATWSVAVSLVDWMVPVPSGARLGASAPGAFLVLWPHGATVIEDATGSVTTWFRGDMRDHQGGGPLTEGRPVIDRASAWSPADSDASLLERSERGGPRHWSVLLRQRRADGTSAGIVAHGDDVLDLPGDVRFLVPQGGDWVAITRTVIRTIEGWQLWRDERLPPVSLPGAVVDAREVRPGLLSLRYADREEWRTPRGDVVATSLTPSAPGSVPLAPDEVPPSRCLEGALAAVAGEHGVLTVADGPPRARFCPLDGRPPWDERLAELTHIDTVARVPEGILVQGRDGRSERWIRLRP